MAHVISDRVKETTATTGTGALTLAGASTGYRAFSAVCSVADTVYYAIEAVDANGLATGDWEVGLGTYSALNTLTRTTPAASSNGGAAVNFAAGTKNVWIDATAAFLQKSFLTSGAMDGVLIGGVTPAAITGTTITATTAFVAPAGASGNPTYRMTSATTGWREGAANTRWVFDSNGTTVVQLQSGAITLNGAAIFGWASVAADTTGIDASIGRTGPNSLIFGSNVAAGGVTSRTEINKTVTAFSNGVAKATFTFTVPNTAQACGFIVRIVGMIGVGGAVSANEGVAVNEYIGTITRTPGLNAVINLQPINATPAAANVAGGTTCTATLAASAVSGAVGAINTFTLDGTITRGGGSSDNHVAVLTCSNLNANASGITIA